MQTPSPLGLYLHIPFCSAICNYCNFNRGLFDGDLKDRYLPALEADILRTGRRLQGDGRDPLVADTIFFGGGTPSLVDPSEVERLIERCGEAFSVDPGAEVTLEANPETLDLERLDGFRRAGVNRLSLGVQSFLDAELRRLSRIHDASRAEHAFRLARQAGFDNVSLDLMLWLPEQTVDDALRSVDRLIALSPDHASMYLLELYPNAPLREEMARAHWSLAPDDDAVRMYLEAMRRMETAGYEQYEISNVARANRESRHNLKYWTGGAWLGFGCGAHSTFAGRRTRNVSAPVDYIDRIGRGASPAEQETVLTRQQEIEDAVFLGLRLSSGLDLEEFERRYRVDVWTRYGADLQAFVEAGLVVHEADRLRLTREGMLVSNDVMSVFV